MAGIDDLTALAAVDVADADVMYILDMSEADGTRDRSVTIAALKQALGLLDAVVSVTEVAHGFSVGDPVRFDGTNWVAANAASEANADVHGVVRTVTDVDTVVLAQAGTITGLSGLTPGDTLYLQDAGGLGATVGTVDVPLAIALTADAALLLPLAQPGVDATIALDDVTDVDTSTSAPTDGQVLTWNNGNNEWEPQDAASSTESFIIACSDETTALTTGASVVTFRMPYAFTLSDVRASVGTAPTGAAIQVDINEGGVSILSTVLSIDATEKTSETAATAAVISDSALADDAEITIDVDQVGSTVAGAGLKVTLIGTQA